jgi:hypothetical protein
MILNTTFQYTSSQFIVFSRFYIINKPQFLSLILEFDITTVRYL